MISNFFQYIVFFLFVLYIYYLIIFYKGIKKRRGEISFSKRKVSVIVAARNEENTLPFLLTGLVNQSYPEAYYEVIVADDESTDRTADIVYDFSQKWNFIKYLRVKDRDKAISPKKNALTQAIELSKGEIILTVDADCIVSKYWIEAMASSFLDRTAMVVGFSRVSLNNWKSARFIQKYDYFDFLAMMITAAGAVCAGKHFSCSGQNLGFLKESYLAVGGYERIKHIISGDDVNLMQLFRKNIRDRDIIFNFNRHSFVKTRSAINLKSFFNQRTRWSSNTKWQLILNPEFFFYLSLILLLYLLILFTMLNNFWTGTLFLLIKMFLDYLFIRGNFEVFEQDKQRLSFFPFWFIIHPIYVLIVGISGIFGVYSWHNRKGFLNK